ncbi:hypothetical protein E3T26_06855 [Cryobacterium sp. TMT1-21]|uniref:hypothetical protein n=1 Tax=Cryobacterium sp. TMT1-21 TaxID=1259234 RepID=UPI0010691738|nr:hypothetical protein [Cryobacterium sp. TMT1-21]TFD15495.1 hypothetical protein E3T26_06855 [Cryobacterium sp. TMT1-21]
MPNTPSAEAFDEALTQLWDEIDLHTSLDNFKSAVKQLVDTHIIGEKPYYDDEDLYADEKRGMHNLIDKQLNTLYPNNNNENA